MFGMQVLDVAIGMIFVYLMLSLVVTAFNELVAAWLKRRAKTLWSGVVRLLGDEALARSIYAHPLIASLSQSDTGKPSYIPSRTFVLAVLDGLTAEGVAPPATLQEVAAAVQKLPPTQRGFATALTVLMHDSAGSMEEFKKSLEQWFDNSMERVSGWYKRETQWVLLVMAAGVTIWTNADTIVVANTLWRDPAMRSVLVAQAEQADQQHKENQTAPANLDQSLQGIRGLAIPLGWRDSRNADDKREPIPGFAQLGATISAHGLGWLLTALAISLGAPFWFDMLNKVVSIRASGKAPEEKQKSPKQVPTPVEPGGSLPPPDAGN